MVWLDSFTPPTLKYKAGGGNLQDWLCSARKFVCNNQCDIAAHCQTRLQNFGHLNSFYRRTALSLFLPLYTCQCAFDTLSQAFLFLHCLKNSCEVPVYLQLFSILLVFYSQQSAIKLTLCSITVTNSEGSCSSSSHKLRQSTCKMEKVDHKNRVES